MTNTAPPPAKPAFDPLEDSHLLDRVRDAIRLRHYSLRTERSYSDWVRRYLGYHGMRHPSQLGPEHVTAFLSSLATERHVSASTQNQALAALLFLYREVLKQEIAWMEDITRAKRPRRLPVVLTRVEVTAMLGQMSGTHALMAGIGSSRRTTSPWIRAPRSCGATTSTTRRSSALSSGRRMQPDS